MSYLKDTTEKDFLANNEKQDAVLRRIEIIGEATAHLAEETRQAIPELSFRKMRGMRNIVAHDYANIDLKVVWEVGVVHVPEIRAVLERFFARYEHESIPPPSSPSSKAPGPGTPKKDH